MSAVLALGGGAAAFLAALALYLASPHQQLLPSRPWPRATAMTGLLAMAVSLGCLLEIMGPATAVFTALTLLMLFTTLPPLLFAWLRYRKVPGR
ncbi:MAG TPA: hypothetical protein VIG90_17525 [Pedomonas sp.]|uniref:hypothetical protein n=1 Tax=Pedomonas sp. TaxID=2976421 RepID=UPI002F3F0D50